MNDPVSAPDTVDGLLGQFLEELEQAADPEAVVSKWSAAQTWRGLLASRRTKTR